MRFWLSLILLGGTAVGLALFPSIASRMMTIEVMGWHLEIKQGLFLALLLLLVLMFKLLLWLVRLLLQGPERLLAAWRSGGYRRQESRVRSALLSWANGEQVAVNTFAVSTEVLPAWLGDALAALINPAHKVHAEDTPLEAALRGRSIADDRESSLALRQSLVAAWRAASPRSTLALERSVELAEEGEDWQAVLDTIEQAPRGVVVANSQERRAQALYHLAQEEPSMALVRLRQAVKLLASDEIVIALAAEHRNADDLKSARTVLLDALDRRDSLAVAKALAEQEKQYDNPLLTLHMLDKRCRKRASLAQRWLLVQLSRQAEDGERVHYHLRLLKQMPGGSRLAWKIEADTHMESRDWESAAHCYQQFVDGISSD
ncbi:MAG: heme biosynthesis HemY N-terminal domain-containing protein [Mariprofundales bacterium]|nr:heme biosynthesis HemY N-terminal domain-containing protein [Mariprofundales bacterium]